jgi:hypothetical protein
MQQPSRSSKHSSQNPDAQLEESIPGPLLMMLEKSNDSQAKSNLDPGSQNEMTGVDEEAQPDLGAD